MYKTQGLLIEGAWRQASDGATMPVHSPVTEAQIGSIPAATAADQDAALTAAARSFPHWAAMPAWDRAAILRRTADLLRARADDLARVMSTETGKPLAEARGEVMASADQFEWQGEEAKRIYGQTIPGRNPHERLSVIYQPVGPCLALSAWNFPDAFTRPQDGRRPCRRVQRHRPSGIRGTGQLLCAGAGVDGCGASCGGSVHPDRPRRADGRAVDPRRR